MGSHTRRFSLGCGGTVVRAPQFGQVLEQSGAAPLVPCVDVEALSVKLLVKRSVMGGEAGKRVGVLDGMQVPVFTPLEAGARTDACVFPKGRRLIGRADGDPKAALVDRGVTASVKFGAAEHPPTETRISECAGEWRGCELRVRFTAACSVYSLTERRNPTTWGGEDE
jgi:hypothetical protein